MKDIAFHSASRLARGGRLFLVTLFRFGAEAEKGTQRGESVRLFFRGIFFAQEHERAVENGERPAALEKAVGRKIVARVGGVAFLGVGGIEVGEDSRAALLRQRAILLIAEEAANAGEKKRAQLALARISLGEGSFFQQPREEALREILGFVRAPSRASNVGIDGISIRLAKLCERRGRSRVVAVDGALDEAPARRLK